MRKQTFEVWMDAVEKAVQAKTGLSLSDLPDSNYRDWYEDGMTAKGAANKAIRSARE